MLVFGNIHFAEFLRGNLKATGNSSWVAVARLERWSKPPPPRFIHTWFELIFFFLLCVYFSIQYLFFWKAKIFTSFKNKKTMKSNWSFSSILCFLTKAHGTHTKPLRASNCYCNGFLCPLPVLCIVSQMQIIYSCSCYCAQILAWYILHFTSCFFLIYKKVSWGFFFIITSLFF